MKLPWQKTEEIQTPARDHLADLIEPVIRAHPRVRGYRRIDDNEGPLGGIADTFMITYEHEGRETICKIAIYGDTPNERIERFGE